MMVKPEDGMEIPGIQFLGDAEEMECTLTIE